MSSYKRIIIYVFLIFFVIACTAIQNPIKEKLNEIKYYNYKSFDQEDKFIMHALEYEKQGLIEDSRELFFKLYTNTSKDEYLFEYIKKSFFLKKYDDIILNFEANEKNIIENKNSIEKFYILSLVQVKRLDEALLKIKALIEKENTERNRSLLGSIYVQKGEYKEAKEIFEEVYKKSLLAVNLIPLTDVMYIYLDEKNEAINYLESYIKLYGCKDQVCQKLLKYYQEQKNVEGIISVLKKSYYEMSKSEDNTHLEKIYKLLMYYLMEKDVKEAILFLEQSRASDDELLKLYRNQLEYKKAYDLAIKLYEKTSSIDYLAQIAILEFEIAEDKNAVIQSVIQKFEDVLIVLDNHIYQNYLGYILIDFDIDIEKGVEYIKKALEKEPNNLAYLDSLAWGQYKLNDCGNAFKNMKKVIDNTGLSDKEIIIHWNKIKECNK